MEWQSNAKWDKFQTTTDRHRTKEQAQSVCKLLLDAYNMYEPCPTRGTCVEAWVSKIEED